MPHVNGETSKALAFASAHCQRPRDSSELSKPVQPMKTLRWESLTRSSRSKGSPKAMWNCEPAPCKNNAVGLKRRGEWHPSCKLGKEAQGRTLSVTSPPTSYQGQLHQHIASHQAILMWKTSAVPHRRVSCLPGNLLWIQFGFVFLRLLSRESVDDPFGSLQWWGWGFFPWM